jgi:hypothetical protein
MPGTACLACTAVALDPAYDRRPRARGRRSLCAAASARHACASRHVLSASILHFGIHPRRGTSELLVSRSRLVNGRARPCHCSERGTVVGTAGPATQARRRALLRACPASIVQGPSHAHHLCRDPPAGEPAASLARTRTGMVAAASESLLRWRGGRNSTNTAPAVFRSHVTF